MARSLAPVRRMLVVLGLVGWLLPPAGCSWMLTTPPPEVYNEDTYLFCTTNRAPPAIDTLFTITNLLSVIYVGAEDDVQNKDTAIALGLSVATLWAVSASYGFKGTKACEEARTFQAAAVAAHRRKRRVSPAPAAPPSTGPNGTVQMPPDQRAVEESATPAVSSPGTPDAGTPAIRAPQQTDDE